MAAYGWQVTDRGLEEDRTTTRKERPRAVRGDRGGESPRHPGPRLIILKTNHRVALPRQAEPGCRAAARASGRTRLAATKRALGFDPRAVLTTVDDDVIAHTRALVNRGVGRPRRSGSSGSRRGRRRKPEAQARLWDRPAQRRAARRPRRGPAAGRARHGDVDTSRIGRRHQCARPSPAGALGRVCHQPPPPPPPPPRPGRVESDPPSRGGASFAARPAVDARVDRRERIGRVLHFGIREHANGRHHQRHSSCTERYRAFAAPSSSSLIYMRAARRCSLANS